MDSDDSVNTSLRMPVAMQQWLGQQARVRDSSVSALVRSLIREAQAAVFASEGVGGPASWPAVVAPPLHERTPIRGRPGRLRDAKGRFALL